MQRSIKQLTVPLKEAHNIIDKKFHKDLFESSSASIKSLNEDLKKVDKNLEQIIKTNDNLNKNYELIIKAPREPY